MAQPAAGSHLPEWEQVDIPLHMLSNGEAGGRPVRVNSWHSLASMNSRSGPASGPTVPLARGIHCNRLHDWTRWAAKPYSEGSGD
jgi:hypothetical protein